jgi:hypothetical protein
MEKFDALDTVGQQILKAFTDPNDWRTPGGIARATGLDPQAVESYIQQHASIFMEFPMSPNNRPLYGLADAFKKALSVA